MLKRRPPGREIAVWQAGASAGLIPTLFLPAPVAIARAIWALTLSGELWSQIYRLNHGYDPQYLIPEGTILLLPANAQVDPADMPAP